MTEQSRRGGTRRGRRAPGDIQIVDSRIERYLEELLPSTEPVLLEMEAMARAEGFPIVGPLVGRLLRQLALTVSARDIFEMGSGFGYSTYFLAQAVGDGGRVVHTERSPERSLQARQLLERAGLASRVIFEVGDALQILISYPSPFDLIFIDVDKEAYPEALELARARVRPGGYIVTDNVLWHGRVLDQNSDDPATRGVQAYLRAALTAPDLLTSVLPLRDGVALHLKLSESRRRR
ncbi:MAG: O-methyltransferase [Myxococcales bacterium]|nr:O-methyltransferase [Myxococcota bacterium]MDW8282343.1 O-methyltransferase [Myxococcales bacterium]